MKKTIKRTAALVLSVATTASIAGVSGISTQKIVSGAKTSQNVLAEETKAYLSIRGYEKSVKLNDDFALPTCEYVESASSKLPVETYEVTTPTGEKFTSATEKNGEKIVKDGKFKVTEIGTYTIAYTYGDYVGEVTFEAYRSQYEIKLVDNNSNILPNKVAVQTENGSAYTGTIKIQDWKLYDEDGNPMASEDVIVETECIDPNYQAVAINNGSIVFDAQNPITEGFYIITYTAYEKQANGDKGEFLASTTAQFEAVNKKEFTNEAELTLSFASEKPTKVNVGKTIELPAINARKNDTDVPVWYEVKVYKNGAQTPIAESETISAYSDTKIITQNEDGIYEFTADQKGVYYSVEYTAYDALGKQAKLSFKIDNVTDDIKPTPIVVDYYETETEQNKKDLNELENIDYSLKSIFGDEDVVIKPIYAEDFGTLNYADFKFERRIENASREVVYKSTELEDARKNIVFNAKDAEALETAGQSIIAKDKDGNAIKLANGTYYAYYKVTDANNNEKSISYKFVVDDTFDWEEANGDMIKPTVSFNDTFYSNVDKGTKVEFGTITAKDDKDDRLETAVYYSYFDANGDVIATHELQELELNDDNKYEILTKDAPDGAITLVIYAKAYNDGGNNNLSELENADANLYKTVNEAKLGNRDDVAIIALNHKDVGVNAPTVYEVQDLTQSLVQGKDITIPTVVFEDAGEGADSMNATIAIRCKTPDGEIVDYDARNALAIKSGDYLTISGAKFLAATDGEYQISVKVTDAAGNTAIKFFNYTVAPAGYASTLKFSNMGIVDTTLELGKTLKLQAAEITGATKADYEWAVRCVEGPTNYELSNKEFKASKVGEYKLQYVMYKKGFPTDIEEDQTVEFTVTVEDKTAPVINVDWNTTYLNGNTVDEMIKPAYEKGVKILIPKFSASDMSGLDKEKSTIVISSNKTTKTIKFSEMNDAYKNDGELYYEFAYNAEYTITYTAVDTQGNSSKVAKTIKVGDLIPPTMVVSDKIVEKEYTVKKDPTPLVIDLEDPDNFIEIADNETLDLSKQNIKVSLTVDGTTVEADKSSTSTKYVFMLEDAGNYELKLSIKDDAGYERVVTKTFEVKANSSSTMTSTEAIGTILIVVSVVVLAGVVVYFVLSKKKMDKLYK